MITDYSSVKGLFELIDVHLRENVTIYMIGGGALMRHGMKTQTKDIDVVVDSEREFKALTSAFVSAGFVCQLPEPGYERMTISQILIKEKFRVDIFCRSVCNRFSLSKGMMSRSVKEELGTERVELRLCSVEDIFLFKTMTERDGDEEDCKNILMGGEIDWNVILDEAVEQSKNGKEVWITWIAARLGYFKKKKMRIPIMKEINKLADEYIDKWERDLLQK